MVIAVPVAARLGLGSVLGYLAAGLIIGPILGLVGSETTDLQHVAEFGVVLMLFLIGLELEPKALWAMRKKLLGLGGLQIALTTMVIFVIALSLEHDWHVALTIGVTLSLSSTAIVLQTLNEKRLIWRARRLFGAAYAGSRGHPDSGVLAAVGLAGRAGHCRGRTGRTYVTQHHR